jgi:hypothetical protein
VPRARSHRQLAPFRWWPANTVAPRRPAGWPTANSENSNRAVSPTVFQTQRSPRSIDYRPTHLSGQPPVGGGPEKYPTPHPTPSHPLHRFRPRPEAAQYPADPTPLLVPVRRPPPFSVRAVADILTRTYSSSPPGPTTPGDLVPGRTSPLIRRSRTGITARISGPSFCSPAPNGRLRTGDTAGWSILSSSHRTSMNTATRVFSTALTVVTDGTIPPQKGTGFISIVEPVGPALSNNEQGDVS